MKNETLYLICLKFFETLHPNFCIDKNELNKSDKLSEQEDNEILISIPYNENNILIESEDVERLLRNFNIIIKVNNIEIFREAMSHYSYVKQKYYAKYTKEMNDIKKSRNTKNL